MDIQPETWEMWGRVTGAGIALGFGGIGAAIGMGNAAGQAGESIMRQPEQQGPMLRTMLIGQAVGGSPSIFALVIGFLILLMPSATLGATGIKLAAIMLGAGLSIGLGCFGSGLGCGLPAGAACDGTARNPHRTSQIVQAMVIGQAVAQSPSIFATVIALMLMFVRLSATGWAATGICIGAGLATGAAALGPGIGSGSVAGGAIRGLSNWPRSHGLTIRTMLIGQAVCQTPAIFGMLVAFIMMFALKDVETNLVGFAKTLGAAIAVGFGGIGPGIGSGMAGDKACEASAMRPDKDTLILRTMLIGQAVSQSTAIYGLIIALAILVIM